MSKHARQPKEKQDQRNCDRANPRGAGNQSDLHDEMDDRPNRYLLEPTFMMTLSGDWETGGVVEFLLGGQLLDLVKVAPAPWAVMASLFLAAIHSKSTHWQRAFVPTKRLIELLVEHDLASLPDDQTVHRHINKIRSKLAATIVRKFTGNPHLSGMEWAMHVIETSRSMGYRIGLPPSQLQLFIGDVKHSATTDTSSDQEGKEKQEGSSNEWSQSGGSGIDLEKGGLRRKAK